MGLRYATEQDLPRIVDIYNAAIPSRRSTADTEQVTPEARLEWFRKHQPERRPLLVYEREEGVVAWMSFEDFYGRPAYRHTAELSIYIDPRYQGKLLGKSYCTQLRRWHRSWGCTPSLAMFLPITRRVYGS
ncbi:GNAT family N-acetyltransferase [Billgrantia desiderata]|uniref:GNAT family N-acetyltransferase n=1 Tax=Billgrantia desiderata TaxID=52021 RepID=UPI0028A13C6C